MPRGLPPEGTVTFLFTDIEGSTKLWEANEETMRASLARHDALMRQAIARANGFVFKTIGDAFCAAFSRASEALEAAAEAQSALAQEPWPEATPIKVRMALHTGAVESRDDDYFGPPVNRVARLLATGHGGQVLLSQITFELVRDSTPAGASYKELGTHQLKDLARPEQVFQLVHPGLASEFPPIRSLSYQPNNLPQQVTNFIGREREVAEVEALLERARMVTLIGTGGTGKTRLSLQVAANRLDDFPDGAWLAELAPLSDPALVPQAVAAVFGVQEDSGKTLVSSLAEHLKGKRLLLLLDNCEHVLQACAELASAILRACPDVRLLASSREPLGIAGEQAYRVPSLSLPDPKLRQTVESLNQCESVRLFIDRALLSKPDFQVTNASAPALASLCVHLDGIPLAIELAAARVRSLSVEEIDRRLDQRFRLLTGGSRTALPRQQTLRSLIDWSYDLLNAAEKALLGRLSVFSGGWTMEAAERVCAGAPVEEFEVLDLLTSLCDKSLVVTESAASSTRYRLLETVRQYAGDRLEEAEQVAQVRDRHLEYFADFAAEADPQLKGPHQQQWLDAVEAEHDNLRTALSWSQSSAGRAAAGLRLSSSIWMFWFMRGPWSEGRSFLEHGLAQTEHLGVTPERAMAMNGVGVLAMKLGDKAASRQFHGRCLEMRRALGDTRGIASSTGNLGLLAHEEGDYAGARAQFLETLAAFREVGDEAGQARALHSLGEVASAEGDFATARSFFQESLERSRRLSDPFGITNGVASLGWLAIREGDLGAAQTYLDETLERSRTLGLKRGIAWVYDQLGTLALAQGDLALARSRIAESLTLFHELGARDGVAGALDGTAFICAKEGDLLRAARLWGAAEALREAIGTHHSPSDLADYEPRVLEARARLGDDAAFESAWAAGRRLLMEEAIEQAIEQAQTPPRFGA